MKILSVILFITITYMASAQTKIYLTAGDKTMAATLVDNSATRELVSLLSKGDIRGAILVLARLTMRQPQISKNF